MKGLAMLFLLYCAGCAGAKESPPPSRFSCVEIVTESGRDTLCGSNVHFQEDGWGRQVLVTAWEDGYGRRLLWRGATPISVRYLPARKS